MNCDFIIAAECLWLRELVKPFCDTVVSLLRPNGSAKACVLSFRDRSSKEATEDEKEDEKAQKTRKEEEEEKGAFVPVADVVAAFETRRAAAASRAWRRTRRRACTSSRFTFRSAL